MPTATLPAAPSEAALVDVQFVARLLSCSPRHVFRLEKAALMPPARRLNCLVRWNLSEIERWIANGCQPVGGGR
jgi:predicted DNA-binding transcriptional regulator AlpA